jgi:hypothetical protein
MKQRLDEDVVCFVLIFAFPGLVRLLLWFLRFVASEYDLVKFNQLSK